MKKKILILLVCILSASAIAATFDYWMAGESFQSTENIDTGAMDHWVSGEIPPEMIPINFNTTTTIKWHGFFFP